MTTIVDKTEAQIATRIRLERDARGWSQAELAAHSGVAKATVSKIERQEMSPTAITLLRLAGAFDLTLAGLLLRAEGGGADGQLSRAQDQPVWRDPQSGYHRKQVFMRPDHPLELVQVGLPAGQRVNLPASSYAQIRQVVWVQTGQLVIEQGRERAVLGEGDCLGFGPPTATALANETDRVCTYLVALARR
ncbi:helix-turn-helix domain-containing protein [Deinococcus frigens]|uniref:helix-turn-helix domain-containing protein n=1 Tax=Deinococcus frigens TaxID=249403 RepID=UPI00049739EC|nr:XRE family transcriptional regulator [Deinococcus frigens]